MAGFAQRAGRRQRFPPHFLFLSLSLLTQGKPLMFRPKFRTARNCGKTTTTTKQKPNKTTTKKTIKKYLCALPRHEHRYARDDTCSCSGHPKNDACLKGLGHFCPQIQAETHLAKGSSWTGTRQGHSSWMGSVYPRPSMGIPHTLRVTPAGSTLITPGAKRWALSTWGTN